MLASGRDVCGEVGGAPIILNDNGAWCWYEGERAIIDRGKLIVGTVADSSGAGGAARDGNIEVATYDFNTGEVTRFVLHENFQPDDHDSAALYVRSDGRYLAMYAKHGSDAFTRWRITTNPNDTSDWQPVQTFNNGAGTTYSNVYRMSAENGGAGRLYNFNRSVGFNPNAMISDDDGTTWSYGGRLLAWPRPTGDPKYTGSDGGRPYLRYQGNGVDEIHFITTEDHPRAYDNSIYHGVVRGGKVYDSFGNVVDDNFFDGIARKPNEYTVVFDTDTSPLGFAWTTDLRLDRDGQPYALMTARADNNNVNDHRFLYARFNGTGWSVHEIAKAGGYLYSPENDYTGLGALDPRNPDVLYISTEIDPRNDLALSHYEIFKGITGDGGATWTWTAVTENSPVDNLRPIMPVSDGPERALLWFRGTYTTFTNFNVETVALTWTEPTGITFVDAVPHTDAEAGNTTVDGALVDFAAGTGNATTGGSQQSGSEATDDRWHYRTRATVNGGAIWETDLPYEENTAPLITTLELMPGRYKLYGLFWNNLDNGGLWDISFRVGAIGEFTRFSRQNANLTDADGHDFVNAIVTRDGAQWLLAAPLGEFDVTGPVSIYVNAPDYTSGDDRTWYEGVGYELVPPACEAIPAVSVQSPVPPGATTITVTGIDSNAASVNVYVNGTTLVGSVAGDPPNTPSTLVVGVIPPALDDRVIARQVIGEDESCRFARAVRVGDCTGVPGVAIQGPLSAGGKLVTVTGVDPAASVVKVYADRTNLIGSASGNGTESVQVSVDALLSGQVIAATQTLGGVEGCMPSMGLRVPFHITYIDADPNRSGTDGNTTINGEWVVTAAGGNATTSDAGGSASDGKWHVRSRTTVNGDEVWEGGASETPATLITTVTLAPATYELYGVLWNNSDNTGVWDIGFRVGPAGEFRTFDKSNAMLAAADGSDFANSVIARDSGQWLLLAPLGRFDVTEPMEIHVQAPILSPAGDQRSWYDGIGYEQLANDPFADVDNDDDVDQEDFAVLQRCITGPAWTESLPTECRFFDRNGDGSVGLEDMDAFAACKSGPSVPADPACDD